MKRSIPAFVALILVALGASAQGRLELRLVPGPVYSHTKWFGPAPIKLLPQAAFWIETSDGRFVDSIYVTHRSAAADWRFGAGARRPESLPLWSHSRGLRAADGLFMPDAGHPLSDAISGATPEAAFAKTWTLPAGLAPGWYRIRAELNLSYDWNEAYPDKLPRPTRAGAPRTASPLSSGKPSSYSGRRQLPRSSRPSARAPSTAPMASCAPDSRK